jgi:thioredoxin-related protein
MRCFFFFLFFISFFEAQFQLSREKRSYLENLVVYSEIRDMVPLSAECELLLVFNVGR